MLLQPKNVDADTYIETDGYQLAKVRYNDDEESYELETPEWKHEERKKSVLEGTRPHTLRTVFSRGVTLNNKLFIFHNLAPKDEQMPKTMVRTPLRVMDFETSQLMKIDYRNDDSSGTQQGEGERNALKQKILPSTQRINYSIASFKNRVYLFGGLNEKRDDQSSNQVLNSMEMYDAMTLKFQP